MANRPKHKSGVKRNSLGIVMPNRPDPDESNKRKVITHGFDTRYSFRKDKQKKK